jgi:hypothetical protein
MPFQALNKQHYEPIAPRYMAVFRDSCVRLHLTNVEDRIVVATVPLHPKNPAVFFSFHPVVCHDMMYKVVGERAEIISR